MTSSPLSFHPHCTDPSSPYMEDGWSCRIVYDDGSTVEQTLTKLKEEHPEMYDKASEAVLKEYSAICTHTPEDRRTALEALQRGDGWKMIKEAMDELIAGEDGLKELLYYSGLSSGLKDKRLHVFMMGDSQQGKSFVQSKIAINLFTNIAVTVNSLSAKALQGETSAKNDSTLYDHKLLQLDELKDQGEGTRATIKALTSNGQQRIVSKTLDMNRRFTENVIEGVPVVWTNSMEIFEDEGNQLSNRFLKANIDESAFQTIRVVDFQKIDETLGSLKKRSSSLPVARAVIDLILSEKNFEVLNPFSVCLDIGPQTARNVRPMLHTLLSSVTYSRRYQRPYFELDDGRKFLIATLSDNLKALEIWDRFISSQLTGLPDRYRHVLDAMLDDEEYSVDDARSAYMLCPWGQEHPLSSGTVGNYLHEMSEKNLVSARRKEDTRIDGSTYLTREYRYSKILHKSITTQQPSLWRELNEHPETLDGAIEKIKEAIPQLHNGTVTLTREMLLDTPVPELSGATQGRVDIQTNSEDISQDDKVSSLRGLISRKSVSLEIIQRTVPSLHPVALKLLERGQVGQQSNGVLFWR